MDSSENPFSTRYFRPGAIPYSLPSGVEWDGLVAKCLRHRRSAILGPHGCGKSTFLQTFLQHWIATGRAARLERVAGDGSIERSELTPDHRAHKDDLLCVDGWESLTWVARARRQWLARATHLLITCHRPPRMPVLFQPVANESVFVQLAQQLQSDVPRELRVSESEVRRCFQEQAGNARETWFALYDRFEANKRQMTNDK